MSSRSPIAMLLPLLAHLRWWLALSTALIILPWALMELASELQMAPTFFRAAGTALLCGLLPVSLCGPGYIIAKARPKHPYSHAAVVGVLPGAISSPYAQQWGVTTWFGAAILLVLCSLYGAHVALLVKRYDL